jgi:hypothetical protein
MPIQVSTQEERILTAKITRAMSSGPRQITALRLSAHLRTPWIGNEYEPGQAAAFLPSDSAIASTEPPRRL